MTFDFGKQNSVHNESQGGLFIHTPSHGQGEGFGWLNRVRDIDQSQ